MSAFNLFFALRVHNSFIFNSVLFFVLIYRPGYRYCRHATGQVAQNSEEDDKDGGYISAIARRSGDIGRNAVTGGRGGIHNAERIPARRKSPICSFFPKRRRRSIPSQRTSRESTVGVNTDWKTGGNIAPLAKR